MEKPFYKRKGVLILAVLVGFLLLFVAVTAATVSAARRRELDARRPTGEARRVLAGALRRIRGEAARLEATIWAYESELGDMAEMAVIIIEGGRIDEDYQAGEPEEREDHPAL